MTNYAAPLPTYSTPFLEKDGRVNETWYRYLVQLQLRTGGGSGIGNSDLQNEIDDLQSFTQALNNEINAVVPEGYAGKFASGITALQKQEQLVPIQRTQTFAADQLVPIQRIGTPVPSDVVPLQGYNPQANFSRVYARNTAGQSIANNAFTTITGWTSILDSLGEFNAVTGVLTVKNPGIYFCDTHLRFDSATWNSNSVTVVQIAKNGTYFAGGGDTKTARGGASLEFAGSAFGVIQCAAGDLLRVDLFQNNGAAINLYTGTVPANTFSIVRIS